VRQRAEQAQEIEAAMPHQRKRRRDAAGRKERVGIREEQILGARRASRPRDARVQRVNLAHPLRRTGVDLDDLEAVVAADGRSRKRRGFVGATIEHERHLQIRVGFRAQRPNEPVDDPRLVVGRDDDADAPRGGAFAASDSPSRSVGTRRTVRSTRCQMNPQTTIVAMGPTHSSAASDANSQCGMAGMAGARYVTRASIQACAGSLWKCHTRCGPAITLR
jgi:hypothetical protein